MFSITDKGAGVFSVSGVRGVDHLPRLPDASVLPTKACSFWLMVVGSALALVKHEISDGALWRGHYLMTADPKVIECHAWLIGEEYPY